MRTKIDDLLFGFRQHSLPFYIGILAYATYAQEYNFMTV